MKYIYTLLGLLMLMQAQATVRRVRAGAAAGGNGTSWTVPYNNLQTAIDASASGDEIWVAVPVGTAKYQPASGVSYNMKDGVKIYGGFAGTETTLISRSWQTNPTTLQGNNSSVVSCPNNITSSAVLDGFTITGGNNYFGGGINTNNASATFSNLIITNNYASNSGGGFYTFGSPTLTNVVLSYNTCGTNGTNDEKGGGLYIDQGNPIVTNCIFDHNYAHRDGGGVYAYEVSYTSTRKPTFINCLFSGNESGAGAGGAVFGEATSYIFTNCTFYGNTCYLAGCAGGIHNYGNSSDGATSNTVIKNCLFWGNFVSYNGVQSDLYNTPSYATTAATYSMMVGPPTGSGNVAPSGTIPFANPSDPDGADNLWFTADDGFRLILCNAAVIDKGDNSAISATTDLAGNIRKFDVPLVADAGSGTAPIVDLGAYENQTATTALAISGSIGNRHTIPNPQELSNDMVTSVVAPISGTISWQSGADSLNWSPASPAGTQATYPLPALTQTTYYRRVITSSTYCNTPYYSNVIGIKVINPNGIIVGRVTSKSGNGVPNINILVKRTGRAPVSGTDTNKVYTAITDGDGYYTASGIYYGDPAANATDTFRLTPQYPMHKFNPSVFNGKVLTYQVPQPTNPVNFVDTTVFTISGKVVQDCNGCTGGYSTCPLDSVQILKNNAVSSNVYTGLIGGVYGSFTTTIDNPGTLTLTPSYKSHVFLPAYQAPAVTSDVSGILFTDTTTHLISGYLLAGCSEYVGIATLEFTDILPNDANNQVRTCAKKTLTTLSGSGYFSIRLPARKYKIKVTGFTSAAGSGAAFINPSTLMNFFNSFPDDSLKVDLTTRDTAIRITYVRPPVLQLSGLDNLMCNQNSQAFAVVPQASAKLLTVKVFQGDPTVNAGAGCPITDTSRLKLTTSVQANDNSNADFYYSFDSTGKTIFKLTGGSPFIAGNHYKPFQLNYNDRYNRKASLLKNVVVTGILADSNKTFATVSPQIPFLVLHDPPGDQSFSTWSSTQTFQSALRLYTAKSNSVNTWLEAKLGTKVETGIGVAIENEFWGKIGGNLSIGSASTSAREAIITTATSTSYSTSALPVNTGKDGDVYIGAALNVLYSKGAELYLNTNTCMLSDSTTFIVAPDSLKTQFFYTEYDIKNTIIPNLLDLAGNTAATQRQRDSSANQVKVWQQAIANNEKNRNNAAYVGNLSFTGGGIGQSSSTTASVSSSNTLEFTMTMDGGVAAELGFEVAGSGLSGGVQVNFKTETGQSTTLTSTSETTVGYTLQDNDPGDLFSVDVKKDPQYATPVFQTVGGQSSCPSEEGTVSRDNIDLVIPVPTVSNVPAGSDANFTFNIYHTSTLANQPVRDYTLSFDYANNPNGAFITISGNTNGSIPLHLSPSGNPVVVPIKVRQSAATDTFAYEGLRFVLQNDCGDITKTGTINAYFQNACSSVTMAIPQNGWFVNSGATNILPVLVKDYTVSALNSISLEYTKAGMDVWNTVTTLQKAFLATTDPAVGTIINWNVASLPDSVYNIRLRLNCNGGVTYSLRANGTLDRKAPDLFGKPEPTDDNYTTGDVISFSYTEKLSNNSLNNGQVTLRSLRTNALIPITVSGYDNKIIVVPNNSLSSFTGDTLRVIVTGIADQFGNAKAKPDTMYFTVGTSTPSTAANALIVSIANPVVYKNSGSSINITYLLASNTTHKTRVNYTIGGTARYGIDYTIEYATTQPADAYFNGAQGAIYIDSLANQVMLKIKPVADSGLSPDKTIIISLSLGGDYRIGTSGSVTGTLSSEDGITTYTFTGSGNFNVKSNWQNGNMPLTTLSTGKTIYINPAGTCTLNVPLTIRPGASLRVLQGKQFIILGNLKLN